MEDEEKSTVSLDNDVENAIRERVKREVEDAVEVAVVKEEERRYRQLKWLASLIALVGLGTFGTLSNHLIEKAVESKLESRHGNISDSLDFVRYSIITVLLKSGESYSEADRNAVMSYLRRASKNERVRHSPDFIPALLRVTEAFVSAGQSAAIDEIFLLFEAEMLTSNVIVQQFIHHYGGEIVARAADPKDDRTLANFEKLERAANGVPVPELSMAYRALYWHRQERGKVQSRVTELINSVAILNEEDRTRFFGIIFRRTKAENWQKTPNEQGKAFEGITRSFIGTYRNVILNKFPPIDPRLRSLLQEVARTGVNEKNALELASILARARRSP